MEKDEIIVQALNDLIDVVNNLARQLNSNLVFGINDPILLKLNNIKQSLKTLK